MFKYLLACVLLAGAVFAMPEQDFPFGRIVNGKETTIEARPYQVSLQRTSGSHFCGGSIIDPTTIVTAAHCVQTTDPIMVRAGATRRDKGGELVSVRAIKFHEGYNSKTMVNDVAILKLSTPIRQSSTVRYIELAKKTPATGTPAVVSGWGTTCFLLCSSTVNLMEVEVKIVKQDACGSEKYKYGNDKILPTMICADGDGEKKDACQGDSGGPLVADGKLVGVVSWGQGCASTGYPGVYANVADLIDWINKTAASL